MTCFGDIDKELRRTLRSISLAASNVHFASDVCVASKATIFYFDGVSQVKQLDFPTPVIVFPEGRRLLDLISCEFRGKIRLAAAIGIWDVGWSGFKYKFEDSEIVVHEVQNKAKTMECQWKASRHGG